VSLAIGIAIGTLSDRTPPRVPIRSGDFWILAGDFHVHAFPGDGVLTPFSLREEAARAGLDVIAVVNHNAFAAPRLIPWMSTSEDLPLVIASEEVTHSDFHLIAVGIDRRIRPELPVSRTVAAVHNAGGVAIAAHPGRNFPAYDDAALSAVDGTEVARAERREDYRRDYIDAFERARRLNPHVAPIGSSDFHVTPALGASRTFLFVRERTQAGVLDAIRAGRTVAENDRGEMFGDPSLIAKVRSAVPAGRFDPHPSWRRLSVALAWIGIACVVA
jgi:hypothetical protein